MERTTLYNLIEKATKASFTKAMKHLDTMHSSEVRVRETDSQNTYLHFVVLKLADLHRRNNGDVTPAIPLIYRLGLRGCDVNAQNIVGNTCLHVACFRTYGDRVAQHLIRLGVDTGIMNDAGCRVIHDNAEHKCWMVRGQKSAKCSLWSAIQKEDTEIMDRYLKSWCRVNARRRRKTLIDMAYDTGNYRIVERMMRYRNTNELVIGAMACDLRRIIELLSMKSDPRRNRRDKCDLNTCDFSKPIPKPLIAELLELGPIANEVIKILRKYGAMDEKEYIEKINYAKTEFNTNEFYTLVEEGTSRSLDKAWKLTNEKQFNIDAEREDGAGYLHYLVEKYHASEMISQRRHLVRLMYKLVLEGIDVQKRNVKGETTLVSAYTEPPDRILLDHLVQMGVDSSIRSRSGLCIAVNTYATRGELLLQPQLQRAYLPGLWVAAEDGDLTRVRYWLSNLCRVNTRKAGRYLIETVRDLGLMEVADLLEEHFHVTEFATAAMAGDIVKMKHYLAMGNGVKKVNSAYMHYYAGMTDDWKSEFVVRPLIVSTMEYCPAAVSSYLVEFGARLDVHYEECEPCSPVAFWAFRDDIHGEVSLAIAKSADLTLRDELGGTLLHRAVLKRDAPDMKVAIVTVMLERGANVAARDMAGKTARDYCEVKGVIAGDALRQLIDDYVLNLCYVGEIDAIEQLIIEGYDHILDISGTERKKTAKELAYLRYYKELLEMLDEIPKYQEEISHLHAAICRSDMRTFIRLASEKRNAWSIDKRGRNMLHLAVLFQKGELVTTICEQFPQLIYLGDNTQRTPVHYAVSLRDQRATLSLISTSNSVDLNLRDANNMSVLDYIEQVERPIPAKLKPRGRRVYDYQPQDLIKTEIENVPYDLEEEEENDEEKKNEDEINK